MKNEQGDVELIGVLNVVLLIVLCIVASCGNAPATSIPGKQLSTPLFGRYSYVPPPSPVPRGRVVFADRQFPDAANPLFSGSAVDFEVSAALWAAPVFFDQQFHVHADQLTEVPLPENGDVRDGGKTIIMHLRHDLRWSDGQPILASDFQYWWRLDQDPNTGALLTTGYDQIASIETPDNFTVLLHMKRPFGPYLQYLPYAAPQHAWGRLQAIDLQNDTGIYLAPKVTDGPYMLTNFVDGQSYTMAPNSYYTSTTFHGPFIKQLIFRAYSDLTTLSQAVRNGQADVTQSYMEDELPRLGHMPSDVMLLKTPAATYEHLDFNNARPIFQDVRVRRAIEMAIDRCRIIKNVLHEPGCSRLATQVEPLPSLVYDASIQAGSYDPATAKKLLTQEGWLPGPQGILTRHGQQFVIRLVTTADNPLRTAVAEEIQQDLLAVGIRVEIAYYAPGTFFGIYTKGGILATGAYDLAMFGYVDSPDPDDEYAAFHSSQIPSAQEPDMGNYARVADPVIDQALTSGRNTVAFAARVKFYHQFLERLASQVYILPLYVGLNIMTVNSRLQNVLPNADPVANNWNMADWWVS